MPRFEFSEGTSNKFWEIERDGTSFTTTFGKIGTKGQRSTKDFPTEAAAQKEYDKLVAEKTKKGYFAVGDAVATAAGTATPRKTTAHASASAPMETAAASGAASPTAKRAAQAVTTATAADAVAAAAIPSPANAATANATEAALASEAARDARPSPSPQPLSPPAISSAPQIIALSPQDWTWATWRPALVFADDAPFDIANCAARLSKLKTTSWGHGWDFTTAELSPRMGKPEAAFWLAAILNRKKLSTTALLANDLLKHPPEVPTLNETREAIVALPREASHWVALVLGKLFEASDILSMIEDGFGLAKGWQGSRDFIFGMRAFVTARLPPSERTRWRAKLTPAIRPDDFPAPGKSADPYTPMSPQFMIAVILGFHDELLAALQAIPDNTYTTHFNLDWQDAYHMPQLLLFGLNTPADILAHRRRLGLKLHKPHYLTAWLATTEYAGLDDAAASIIDCNNKDAALALARVLAKVQAPQNAGPMLAVALKSKAGVVASEWFANNKEHARVGLTEVAKGKGALAEAAKQRLQEMGSSLDGKPIAKLPVMPSPAWFSDTAIDKKTAKAIEWLDTTILPDLDIAGHRLSPEHVRALVGQLATADIAAAPQAVAEVTARATATSRDAFAWRLFQAWQERGANAKEKWAFAAMGLIGADQCARKLAPLVRAWPGESQHQRAVLGLDVLGRIGTDVALMMLNGIAQKVKFKALQERARDKMAEIAAHRGMTAEQLADRLVPDLDLEDDGSKTLDFGPRSFKVGFDEALKPFVIDAAGTKLSELPKPNSKDDASIAGAATDVWKAMKKDVRALAAIQILRLELGMANSRRWVGHEFKAFFVEHPLMIHLVKRVVWGVFDGADARAALIGALRVAEDRTFCDADDNSYALSDDAIVGLAHPLMLTPASLARWRSLFADYELIQPFEQLTRACFTLPPDELVQKSLNRFAGQKVETKRVLALLNAGWRKGSPQDAGHIGEVYKPIRPGLCATLPLDQGLNAGGMEYVDPTQTLGAIEFSPDETSWWQRKGLFTLGDVDPISLSEVIRDIDRLGPIE